jgi:hypothetical protein
MPWPALRSRITNLSRRNSQGSDAGPRRVASADRTRTGTHPAPLATDSRPEQVEVGHANRAADYTFAVDRDRPNVKCSERIRDQRRAVSPIVAPS